jgi:hypothetical protein|tara:strand:- start:1626 stop:1934 length:309 start_codon:yes stop_codon:yes gene_type:complete
MGKQLSHKGKLAEFNYMKEVNSLIQSGCKNFELRYSATEDEMFGGFYHIEDVEVALLDEQEHAKAVKKLSVRDAIVGIALNKLSNKGLKKITEKSLKEIEIH